jgi:hypothetical protein
LRQRFTGLFEHKGLGQWGLFSRIFASGVNRYDAG